MTKRLRDRTVWMDGSEEVLHFANTARVVRDFGYAVHLTELASIRATDLRQALARSESYSNLVVSDGGLEWINEDVVAHAGIEFEVRQGVLLMNLDVGMDWIDDDEQLVDYTRSLLGDLLARHGAEVHSVEHNGNYVGGPPYPTILTIRPATRGRTLAELFQLGEGAAALVNASVGGRLDRSSTLDLLRAGRGDVLVGQGEGAWLDVKKQLYDLATLRGKVALAQAAARFANSEGGLVVFGFATRWAGSGEIISKVHPVMTNAQTTRRHRQALETHVYPLPTGLTVEIVPGAGGELLVVNVPPQVDETKPFLVHGAIVDGQGEGAFISIVRRHGEDSIPVTAPAVHAAMAMNRIVDRLRSGGPPGDA